MRITSTASINRVSTLDRVVVYGAGLGVFCLGGYLEVRDRPFSDPGLYIVLRIFLSFACAALGASIPGFLFANVDFGKSLTIRSGGALALFVLTYIYSPPPPPPPAETSATLQAEYISDLNQSNIRFQQLIAEAIPTDNSSPECLQINRNLLQMSTGFQPRLGDGFSNMPPKGSSTISVDEMKRALQDARSRDIGNDSARGQGARHLIDLGRQKGCFR